MNTKKRDEIVKVMDMVIEDTRNDAKDFNGKPFNGRTMAEYMGKHGAAISAVAEAIKEILKGGINEPSNLTP